jgi:hypothetical protein
MDLKKIEHIHIVYTEFFRRGQDWQLATELTKIYFSIPEPEFKVVTPNEIRLDAELKRANLVAEMRSYQSFDSWMAQAGADVLGSYSQHELMALWSDYRW